MIRSTPKNYAKAWYQILKTAPKKEADLATEGILIKLYKSGRARWLPEILRLIDEMERAENGFLKVLVTCAHSIPDKQVTEFIMKNLPSKHYEVHTSVDPSLLGGLRIETSDTRWRISLGEKLNQLQRKISPPITHHR